MPDNLFSRAELSLLGDFLDLQMGLYEDHSCNDFTLTATPQHKALAITLLRQHADEGDDIGALSPEEQQEYYTEKDIQAATDEVFTRDIWMLEHFAGRCRALAHLPQPWQPFEIDIIGRLLKDIDLLQRQGSPDACTVYRLDDARRTLLLTISTGEQRADLENTAQTHGAVKDADFLDYFLQRCGITPASCLNRSKDSPPEANPPKASPSRHPKTSPSPKTGRRSPRSGTSGQSSWNISGSGRNYFQRNDSSRRMSSRESRR